MRLSTHLLPSQSLPSLFRLFGCAKQLADHLGNISLASLRTQAERESSGIAYESIRPDGGPRTGIVLCLTGEADWIAGFEQLIGFEDVETGLPWERTTALDLFLRAAQIHQLVFLRQDDATGQRTALALAAADPAAVDLLESAFNLTSNCQEVIHA